MPSVVAIILIVICPLSLFAQDTELKLYRPFGEGLQQATPVIEERLEGQCLQQSQRIKREDAWHCVAQGKVYDPCFLKKYSSGLEVVCPQSPWDGKSVLIQLSAAPDDSQHIALDLSQAYPWAMELTTGEKCEAIDPGQTFDNLPLRYRCDTNHLLMGHLQRCKAEWTMLLQDSQGQVVTVSIKKAWF